MDAPLGLEEIPILRSLLRDMGVSNIQLLALELGLHHATVYGYHNGVDDLCTKLLADWINQRDSVSTNGGATWNSLLKSLKQLYHNGIHKRVVDHIENIKLEKPQIISHPKEQLDAMPETQTTLSVTATGFGLKYQWQKNGSIIIGETSSTLKITLTIDHEGEYKCVVSNDAGDMPSNSARVELLKPPTISKHPTEELEAIPGKQLEMSVLAKGSHLKYQWQKNGERISEADLATYSITECNAEDEGEYKCIVSNDAGESISDVARVTVLKPPIIDQHPTDELDVVPGMPLMLSISARGSRLKYQWQKNGDEIPEANVITYSITECKTDDEGEYKCIVSNDAGKKISNAARITVLIPPTIDEHPSDELYVVPRKQLILSIVARGSHLKYQWQKNENNIPEATLATYVIEECRDTDEGVYKCLVSNDAGEETSNAARIIVLKPPTITEGPTSILDAVPRIQVQLSISANGHNLSYKWEKENGGVISGANLPCLEITADDDHEGVYWCVVSNDAGTVTSRAARLTVLKPPTIQVHPADKVNETQNTVEMSVFASGSFLEYQWQKNILGATSSTYSVKNTTDNEGEYQCIVSNAAGKVISKSARLSVLEPPAINEHPTNQCALSGNEVTLSVSASGSSLKYQWQKNRRIIQNATSNTYKTTADDEGEYQCVVSNGAGSVLSDVAHITILKAPKISVQPSYRILSAVGREATLSITANGNNLKYQWQRNGENITGATSSMYTTITEEEGEYRCVVSNDIGEDCSKIAWLTILEPPIINEQPSDRINAEPGEHVTLSISASGSFLKYQWQKDGEAITGETSHTYSIMETTAADEGKYRCIVSNDADKVTSNNAKLTVLKIPDIIEQPQDEPQAVPGRQIILSVTADSGGDTRYQWMKDGNEIAGANSQKFTILHVSQADEGTYHCVVSNDIGSKESKKAKLSLCLELQVKYILCDKLSSNAPVKAKVVRKLKFLSTSMKKLYDHIRSEENVKNGDTIELYSHEGYPLNANEYTLNCKLYQWKVSDNDLFYVFIRRRDQPTWKPLDPLMESADVDIASGPNELDIESSLFGSFSIKADCDHDSTSYIRCKVAKHVELPSNYITLSTRRGEGVQYLDDLPQLRDGDILTLVLKSPYQYSGPQGTEYGKETYNPTVPQTDRGVSKFFSILKFICSKKRDSTNRSHLLSYLLQLTHCPPLVHALKLLCENSKLSLPCWVALIEGCYQLFHSFLSEYLTDFKNEEVFEFSDYFWGLIIYHSQVHRNKISMEYEEVVLPITIPTTCDVSDPKSVTGRVKDEDIFTVQRILVYHPFECDKKVYVCKEKDFISREIPKVPLPCKSSDLQSYLAFLPITPPQYLKLAGECLTFIPKGVQSYLVYFEGVDPDKQIKVYDPVGCKLHTCTSDRIKTAMKMPFLNSVIVDISIIRELEFEEAIVILLDSSDHMQKQFNVRPIRSRMDAVKMFFEAFIMTCLTYKFNCSMGVYTFGDKPTRFQALTKLSVATMKELKGSVQTVTSNAKQTALYQAVVKAKEDLIEYTEGKPKCRRRILCLGASDHDKKKGLMSKYQEEDVQKLKDELKKHKVIVDAIELADTPKGDMISLAKATGGRLLSPRNWSELFEMHTFLSSQHCLPPTTEI